MRQPTEMALALGTTHPTALTYARGALVNPVSLSVIAFGACVGIGCAGWLGGMLAVAMFITLGVLATRSHWIQHQLDKQIEERARTRREVERMRRLRPAGPLRQQQYSELSELVAEIERADPNDARRFELQELLDHFVRVSVGHQKCLESLRLASAGELPAIQDPNKSPRCREIMARRARHREACLRRIERLAEELDALDELVRLLAQRVACPHIDDELDREIERRLWELDEVDAAMRQLSA